MTHLTPLQLHSNIAVQFKFALGVQKTFHTIPIKFCCRFLTIVKIAYYVELGKIENVLNLNLKLSGNEFHIWAASNLKASLPNLTCFVNERKDFLFYELDLEKDKIFL